LDFEISELKTKYLPMKLKKIYVLEQLFCKLRYYTSTITKTPIIIRKRDQRDLKGFNSEKSDRWFFDHLKENRNTSP